MMEHYLAFPRGDLYLVLCCLFSNPCRVRNLKANISVYSTYIFHVQLALFWKDF